MAKKKTVEKALNIDSILFNCRDYLRVARNSGSFFEKRDMMLTLVFLRFIGEKYDDGIEKLKQTLIQQGLDPEDENIRAAFFDDATFADGTYSLPPEARWSTIINTPAPGLNVALDTALQRLEEEDPQLIGCFVKGTFTARNLAANDIKKIVDEVNKISHKAFGEEKDLIGRVYEYFLKEFAVNATKEEGEFYTPHKEVDGVVINGKCKVLAKKIKDIIDTKSSFADWLNNQNVRNQLKLNIKICLVKNGYPPQYSPEVFSKVMEQVENFEEYSEQKVISYYDSESQSMMMVAEDSANYGKE